MRRHRCPEPYCKYAKPNDGETDRIEEDRWRKGKCRKQDPLLSDRGGDLQRCFTSGDLFSHIMSPIVTSNPLVAAEIVHHDDVARLQVWHQHLLDIGLEESVRFRRALPP